MISDRRLHSAYQATNPYEADLKGTLARARNLTVDRRIDIVSAENGVVDQELQHGAYLYRVSSRTTDNDLRTEGHESVIVGNRKIWTAQFDTQVFAKDMPDGMTTLAVLGFYATVQRAISKQGFPVAGRDGTEDLPELLPEEGAYDDEPAEDGIPLVYGVNNEVNSNEVPTIGRFKITETISYGRSVLFLAHRTGGWIEEPVTYIKPPQHEISRSTPSAPDDVMHHTPPLSRVISLDDYRSSK